MSSSGWVRAPVPAAAGTGRDRSMGACSGAWAASKPARRRAGWRPQPARRTVASKSSREGRRRCRRPRREAGADDAAGAVGQVLQVEAHEARRRGLQHLVRIGDAVAGRGFLADRVAAGEDVISTRSGVTRPLARPLPSVRPPPPGPSPGVGISPTRRARRSTSAAVQNDGGGAVRWATPGTGGLRPTGVLGHRRSSRRRPGRPWPGRRSRGARGRRGSVDAAVHVSLRVRVAPARGALPAHPHATSRRRWGCGRCRRDRTRERRHGPLHRSCRSPRRLLSTCATGSSLRIAAS